MLSCRLAETAARNASLCSHKDPEVSRHKGTVHASGCGIDNLALIVVRYPPILNSHSVSLRDVHLYVNKCLKCACRLFRSECSLYG